MAYTPSDFSHGTYFDLARWGNAGEGCGYVAIQDYGEFRECEIPLGEPKALAKPLKAISIPLGSSVCALDGGSGLIRIYHGHEGRIDFFYRNIEQPHPKTDPEVELCGAGIMGNIAPHGKLQRSQRCVKHCCTLLR